MTAKSQSSPPGIYDQEGPSDPSSVQGVSTSVKNCALSPNSFAARHETETSLVSGFFRGGASFFYVQ